MFATFFGNTAKSRPRGLRSLVAILALGCVFAGTEPAFAANTPRLSMSGQAARADQQSEMVGSMSIFEVQSVGCVMSGIGTTALAAITGTAATMVTGGIALPFAGEIVASFVTYFAAGCAIGAIIAPGVPLMHREAVAATESAADTIAGLFRSPSGSQGDLRLTTAPRPH